MKRSVFLLVTLVVFPACRRNEQAPAPVVTAAQPFVELSAEAIANADIRAEPLIPTTFSPRLKVSATIAGDPKSIARIGSRTPGRVAAVKVVLGEHVRRGQPLVEIAAIEAHQVSLEYETSRVHARAADDALARQRQLVVERVGAEQDLRKAEAESAAAHATLREADEHLRFLGLSAEAVKQITSDPDHETRSIVRSPIDGTVAQLDITIGQVLQGNEDIMTVANVDRLWVELRIYERDLARVGKDSPVDVQVPAYPGRTFSGTVTFISTIVDAATRTAQARALLTNPDGSLRPGMSATALVALRADPSALWLPANSVQQHEGEAVVFVRTGERRFEPRRVVVGPDEGGFIPIRSGVAPGTVTVVHGAFALRGALERAAMEE